VFIAFSCVVRYQEHIAVNASATLNTGKGYQGRSERGNGWSPRNIWINVELKHPNAMEIYFVIFDLARGAAGAEIPLLLKQGVQCVGPVLCPQQGELLSAFRLQLPELEPDASNPLRLIEKKPDGLLSSLSGPPATLVSFIKC
jgi:hypothetical protein